VQTCALPIFDLCLYLFLFALREQPERLGTSQFVALPRPSRITFQAAVGGIAHSVVLSCPLTFDEHVLMGAGFSGCGSYLCTGSTYQHFVVRHTSLLCVWREFRYTR